jgi:molybdopterin-guanine dinucleotide biosynthesis protein A
MPNLSLAASSNEDINIIPLLCIGGQSSRMGTRKELLPFPDGLLAFEHALITIHDAIPAASTIYISLHDETQLEGIRFRLSASTHPSLPIPAPAEANNEQHHSSSLPALKIILDSPDYGDIGPAAGLLATHAAYPAATVLALGCDYPLLPPAALQQLILEYKPPLTCFVNAEGITEPLIAIWSPEALDKLKGEVGRGRSGLNRFMSILEGKKVRPLRESWITGCNTRAQWEETLRILRDTHQERDIVSRES